MSPRIMPSRVRPASAEARTVRAFAALAAVWLVLAGHGGQAEAADLSVFVATPAGRPIADAVVMAHSRAAPAGAVRLDQPLVIEQRDMRFEPFVLVVPKGGEVAFPNRDAFRHHVYSFSPAKTFELKLYGRNESRSVRFERPGVVAVGCNIHDDMRAFIRVVDTPFAGKSGSRGEVRMRDVPQGPVTLTIWHPYIRGGGDVVRQIQAPATGSLTIRIPIEVRSPPLRHGAY